MESATFKDAAGHEWSIKLTIGLLEDLQEVHKLNLLSDRSLAEVTEDNIQPLTMLAGEPAKLAKVLWTCIRSQAEHEGVSKEEFTGTLGGDELHGGLGAIKDAVINFTQSQSPTRAEALAALYEAELGVMDRQALKLKEMLESDATDKMIDDVMNEMDEKFKKLLRNRGKRLTD